jgi:glycerol-3-phosphate acyltransferase PlsY
VATGLGIFLVLAPVAALAGLATWVGVYLATKVSSVGSLAGTLVCVVVGFTLLGSTPISWAGATVGALIWWRHRENIGRLVRGEEAGFKKK